MATGRSAGKWHRPGSAFAVEYSVSLFYEIDALVIEGFRRIARGGIEHGGLLFGIRRNDAIEIRAFRQIECEHAKGPGFSLSAGDLTGLQQQLDTADNDEELTQLVPLGLFISHSRRDLRLTDEEAALFRSLFQEAWHLLLVVKPDRFKPTNFAFVFATEEDLAGTDLASRAFVLPTPNPQERIMSREAGPKPVPVPQADPISVEAEAQIVTAERRILPVENIPVPEAPAAEPIGGFEAGASHPEHIDTEPVVPIVVPPAQVSDDSTRINRWLATIALLALAALVAGSYVWFRWNYVEPPVELHAQRVRGGIVVSWPPAETRTTKRAILRVWNGDSAGTITLSADQRLSGQKTLGITGDDVTIELVAQRWMHERRGVIRVLLTDKQSPGR
jgi:hypothetical protein